MIDKHIQTEIRKINHQDRQDRGQDLTRFLPSKDYTELLTT